MNSFSDLEKLELYAQQIHDSGIDITPDQKNEWTQIAYACASQGEAGREPFHLISSNYPGYSREETDRHFSYCLKTSRNCVSLGSLVKIAKDHGLELKLPKGRRPKSDEQKEEDERNRFERMEEELLNYGKWRINKWLNRTEVKEGDNSEWREIDDQDYSTYIMRLKKGGLNVSKNDMIDMTESRDFSPLYDPCQEYLDSLEIWEEGDPDFIFDMFSCLPMKDEENRDFLIEMQRKWFVNMVAMMKGVETENPLMPIYAGPEYTMKSTFVRNILPPELRKYYIEVTPAQQLDKDFLISMSDSPLISFDELSIGKDQKADALKQAITLNETNVRAPYGRKSKWRKRTCSFIGTTNENQLLPNIGGRRRFLIISIADNIKPRLETINYEGAYSQALHLLQDTNYNYKPTKAESQRISLLNAPFMITSECEAVLGTLLRKPNDGEKGLALAAGDILRLLNEKHIYGRDFNVNNIGKAMSKMLFESRKIHGYPKYLCVVITDTELEQAQKDQAAMFDTYEEE
ncbi:MAG: PriCT-2 domain-containing protein [Prevotella sp.]|nr:PriCT-2 domain-containing protein [Prevotella sp.]